MTGGSLPPPKSTTDFSAKHSQPAYERLPHYKSEGNATISSIILTRLEVILALSLPAKYFELHLGHAITRLAHFGKGHLANKPYLCRLDLQAHQHIICLQIFAFWILDINNKNNFRYKYLQTEVINQTSC